MEHASRVTSLITQDRAIRASMSLHAHNLYQVQINAKQTFSRTLQEDDSLH